MLHKYLEGKRRERDACTHKGKIRSERERERERRNGVIRGGKAAAADLASCLSEAAAAAAAETGRGIRSNKLRHGSFVYCSTAYVDSRLS